MPTEITTKDERSLLLYFEDCAVNKSGRTNGRHMNDEDSEVARRWNKSGFVNSGRIVHKHCDHSGSTWCRLSDEAWEKASKLRKERGQRLWENRNYTTTTDKQASAPDGNDA